MKLRTEMYATNGGMRIDSFRVDSEHDALCAHALMMAVSEWLSVSTNDECAGNVVTWIYHRADELMRSWGFDSGEVDSER